MLFKRQFHAGLASGAITLTFRSWAKPRVRVGGQYRCGSIGLLEVDAVDQVRVGEISDAESRRSGFTDRDALIDALSNGSRRLGARSSVFRVALHYAGPDSRRGPAVDADLSAAELEALLARLDRMDRTSRHGAWTRQTLELIGRRPQVAARLLAPELGRERLPFKTDVRKLKRLGLTLSHDVGYELSPRGRACLERVRSG